jgi:hypothetical protein
MVIGSSLWMNISALEPDSFGRFCRKIPRFRKRDPKNSDMDCIEKKLRICVDG